ncbi:MAG TPA: asparagine synthase (glutamine-hydrolyzing), partial [Polyangiaceae bacterium]|nr:asparagine synthase (glutamine-hydrolyzing) [Polyangiaceae bacterium]
MCGIAGFIAKEETPHQLDAMLVPIRSRGPDGEGQQVVRHGEWSVALGHRRLSIIDLEGGKQPMRSVEEPAAWLTYNGETYNYVALRDRLIARGARFATRSDTEVVLVHLMRGGAKSLVDLDGMFGLALWGDGRLLLARDRFGIKPLYYASLPDGGLLFGSELGCILAHPAIQRRIDPRGLLSYLGTDYAQAPLTLVRGVHKLPPGSYVEWRDGVLSPPTRYWQLPPLGTSKAIPRPEEFWNRFESAVDRQMVADVPVGVLLSGGLDSSCVAVAASRHTRERLLTFCVGFEQASFDESEYARLVARHIGSQHHERFLTNDGVLEVIDEALDRLDEPLADHAYLPNYLLCKLASEHVKVALGGDAADELWGGYPTYRAHRLASAYGHFPELARRIVRDVVLPRLPIGAGYQSWDWKLRKFVSGWDADVKQRHLKWMLSTTLSDLGLAVPSLSGVKPEAFNSDVAITDDRVLAALALDCTTYLPGSILTKVDRSSMAHGLEVRPPFLDDAFVDWSLAQGSRAKVGLRAGKLLARAAARPHLPAVVLNRKKRGFGMPVVSWMRGVLQPRVAAALANPRLWEGG